MKKITSSILAGALFCSTSAHAEGTQIGTAPLLVAYGVTNIFSQIQVMTFLKKLLKARKMKL